MAGLFLHAASVVAAAKVGLSSEAAPPTGLACVAKPVQLLRRNGLAAAGRVAARSPLEAIVPLAPPARQGGSAAVAATARPEEGPGEPPPCGPGGPVPGARPPGPARPPKTRPPPVGAGRQVGQRPVQQIAGRSVQPRAVAQTGRVLRRPRAARPRRRPTAPAAYRAGCKLRAPKVPGTPAVPIGARFGAAPAATRGPSTAKPARPVTQRPPPATRHSFAASSSGVRFGRFVGR